MRLVKKQFLWRRVGRGFKMKTKLLTMTFIFTLISAPICASAQNANASLIDQSINDAIIVGGSGLGGAVLGLSTLSFVEEPSEHLKNVLVGGAIGIIVGVGIVAYIQATKSETIYKQNASLNPQQFTTKQRIAWHQSEQSQSTPTMPTQVGYQFSF